MTPDEAQNHASWTIQAAFKHGKDSRQYEINKLRAENERLRTLLKNLVDESGMALESEPTEQGRGSRHVLPTLP